MSFRVPLIFDGRGIKFFCSNSPTRFLTRQGGIEMTIQKSFPDAANNDSIAFRRMFDEIYKKKAEDMSGKLKIFAVLYLVVTSVTVLVMLTTSFEQLEEKYLPAFMLGQKYALPLIISAMAIAFLFFFEPERLQQHRSNIIMKIIMTFTLLIFTFFLTTVNMKVTSEMTMLVYLLQWIVTLTAIIQFFMMKNNKAAQ